MARALFIIFLLVPLIEIAIFILFGQLFGFWPTMLGVLLTAIIGSFIIRRQGLALFSQIRSSTLSGTLPAKQLAEAMMVGIAGAFLLTPGYFTDVLGFLLLVPMIRSIIYEQIKKRFIIVGRSNFEHEFYAGESEKDFSKENNEKIIDLDNKDWRQ